MLCYVQSDWQATPTVGIVIHLFATPPRVRPELSMGWVDPWVGLDWVEIFHFLVGWVGFTPGKVLQF